jgi:triosephosphate isomerase
MMRTFADHRGSHQRRPIVGGNWKMNTDLASAVELADDVVASCAELIDRCDIVIFPPFPYLQAVGKTLGHHGIALGAQDVYHEQDGAFTGEVSTDMLLDLNVSHVIVGHSERRHVIGESDEIINRKLRAALDAGLHAILCVGETLEQRQAERTDAVNTRQLAEALEDVDPELMERVTIAYEPVWAIGTGMTATPEDAEKAHRVIRRTVADLYDAPIADTIRIQYGGSVKPSNAETLAAQPDIDGFLVGGASLIADDFAQIVRAAAWRSSTPSGR